MSELIIQTPRVFLPALKPCRYLGLRGGRGSGKSHVIAELLVEDHLLRKVDTACLRETQKSLRFSSKKLIESKIASMGVGYHFEIQRDVIKDKNGGIMIFDGMQNHTAESFKSMEGFKNFWFEEARNISARSLEILRPTMRSEGGRMIFTWNPYLASDPIEGLFNPSDLPPRAVLINANYTDNPFFPLDLQEEMEFDRKRDPDKYAHIWLGEYMQRSEARVFNNWRIEECEIPLGATPRYGADFGFSIDPSVVLRCWIDGRNLYIDYEAWQLGCEIDKLPELFMSVPESEKWPLVADTSRPETISYLRNHGFPKILAAVKGARSVEEGVEFLKAYDIIVHPRCQHLIDELTLYSYKTDPLTSKVLPVLSDKNNHCLDALRYACEGVRRAKATTTSRVVLMPQATSWR